MEGSVIDEPSSSSGGSSGLGGQVGRSSQEPEAKRQESSAPSVGQKAEVADADEARGKHVEQEAAQELLDRQGHQALLVGVGGVSPAKGNLMAL